MAPQGVFQAALARSQQREGQNRLKSSKIVSPPMKSDESFKCKREPTTADDICIIEKFPEALVKRDHTSKRYHGGDYAQDPIELSDEDSAAVRPTSLTQQNKISDEVADVPEAASNIAKPAKQNSVDASNLAKLVDERKTGEVSVADVSTEPQTQLNPSTENCSSSQNDANTESGNFVNAISQETSTFKDAEVVAEKEKLAEHSAVCSVVATDRLISEEHTLVVENSGEPKDLPTPKYDDEQTTEGSMSRAPTAYMGSIPFHDKTKSVPAFVDPSVEIEAVHYADKAKLQTITQLPQADAEERLEKAKKTLSEMERLLHQQKRQTEGHKSLPKSNNHTWTEKRPEKQFLKYQQETYFDQQESHETVELPHTGPSGFQIGLAALGLGNPDVLCEHQQFTHGREEKRVTAADLFMRGSTPPPSPEKPCSFKYEVGSATRSSNMADIPSRKRPCEEDTTITRYFAPKRRTPASRSGGRNNKGLTLEEGYFKRHEERIKALKAAALYENNASEGKFDGQEQSLFLNSDSDDDHRQTGGKTLSKATMQSWKAAAEVYPTSSQSDTGQEELETPKILYEYHVSRRTQLEGQDERLARTVTFGPCYTIAEANAIASIKVRQPSKEHTTTLFRPGAWSYQYSKDESGMESHIACGKGGVIQTWVTREIAVPEESIGIPIKAFMTPAWIYIAMISTANGLMTDTGQITSENEILRPQTRSSNRTVLKACTLLDLANRAAGRKWVSLQAGSLPEDSLGSIHKAEMEMRMRHDLEKMDENIMSFDRTFRHPTSGLETRIWVEMVEVEGPRN